MGPVFLIPLLLLFAYIFRKGFLFGFIFCVLNVPTSPLEAAEETKQQPGKVQSSLWESLWYNSDQLGDKAMAKEKPDQALQHYQKPNKIAEALYRAGLYKQAAEVYATQEGAESRYNQANALAQNKQLKEAIEQYEHALKLNPSLKPALKNLETIKNLLKEDENGDQKMTQDGDEDQSESDSKDKQKQSQKNSDESSDSSEQSDEETPNQDSEQENESEKEQGEKEDKQQSAEQQQEKDAKNGKQQQAQAKTAEELEAEKQQQQMIEQWLRQINDDPSRLLRNKLRLEQRRRRQELSGKQPNSGDKEW